MGNCIRISIPAFCPVTIAGEYLGSVGPDGLNFGVLFSSLELCELYLSRLLPTGTTYTAGSITTWRDLVDILEDMQQVGIDQIQLNPPALHSPCYCVGLSDLLEEVRTLGDER